MSVTALRVTCPTCQGRAYRVKRDGQPEALECRGKCAEQQANPAPGGSVQGASSSGEQA